MSDTECNYMACCLTIAGSDSGGNAGVQADLRAFHAYGLHGCTVFAALTAQNPFGVSAVHAVPPDFIAAQLDAVLGVYAIKALKTGMLADAAAIEVVADRIAAHAEIARVIDPVMVATSGARLIADDAVQTLASTYTLPYIANPVSTHGTGCSLAASLAAELALGRDLQAAVAGAKAYVHRAISTSYLVGRGCGVLGWGVDHGQRG